MIIHNGVKSFSALHSSVVTIGNFDGLHRGHQELIQKVLRLSKEKKAESVVMTFEPHPAKVLFPEKKLNRIFPLKDQEEILASWGIDHYIVEPFSRALSELHRDEFLLDWILKPLNPASLVVGYDFSFGSNREGNTSFLQEKSKDLNLDLHVVPPFKIENEIVSSSVIRKLIADAKISKANDFLGRKFYLQGVVEKGAERGRKIGFPTANIYSPAETYPAKGVYACNVYHDGAKYIGVTNVGNNPTFEEITKRPIQVEVHILNFDKFIYGEDLRVEFLEYIRGEKRFSGVAELVEQIKKDVSYVRDKYAKMG
ncbi:MAG: bifunctional riboflavin kinase/FAD synthetase [Bdellovibrionales bacterium]|nr:bifunctional riboflavin kinase/FAD synthetase [Bdellovibrionales bacterium]